MERAAVVRVKRKRGGPSPAEALVLACKRPRKEGGGGGEASAEGEGGRDGSGGGVARNLFKLVATVASEDEPVQKYVQEAIVRDKAAQLLRPSLGSTHRVIQDIRCSKQIKRQENRYRLVASHRPDFTHEEDAVPEADPIGEGSSENHLDCDAEKGTSLEKSYAKSDSCEKFQLLDIVREEDADDDTSLQKPDDPDVILCNAVEMIRQRLNVSDSSKAVEDNLKDDDYVYDIYYMETASPAWIDNILSVQPYTQDYELVDEDRIPEEMYDDEDDENSENNWRNDYPDEDDFLADEDESNPGSVSDEDSGYVRRTWEKYHADVLREFDYDGLEEPDSD